MKGLDIKYRIARIVRYSIYAIIIAVCLFIWLGKLGIFDPETVTIDNIVLEKPFLYRNLHDKTSITLDDHDSASVLFISEIINNGALYTIHKTVDKELFQWKSQFILTSHYGFQIDNINLRDCYIAEKNLTIEDLDHTQIVIPHFMIYKYPYDISFHEVSNERQEKMIRQICGGSKVVKIPHHSIKPTP